MSNEVCTLPSHLFQGTEYHSPVSEPSFFSTLFPSLSFYPSMLWEGGKLYTAALRGQCSDMAWMRGSENIWRNLERVGCRAHIEGMENIAATPEACIFVGNHMSTLDAFGLPAIIRPFRPVTPVVKRSLVTMPVFSAIMLSRDPIAVDRVNPRADFAAVMEGGKERLSKGISMIVFPQSTRSLGFDPAKFNSIGVKLAKHANAPIVPMALKTCAWGQGKKLKDFGKINPDIPIHIRFGKPLYVHGSGKEEQAHICAFIQHALEEWRTC